MNKLYNILLLIFLGFSSLSAQTTINLTATERAEEDNSDGSVDLTGSSDIELTHESNQQTVGLRFTSVSLPQAATINSAYIQFTADESQSGSVTLTFKCEDVDNSSAFSTSNYNISSRTTTTASVDWSPNAWTAGDAGADQKTVDLKSIIQEVVNRSGWSWGNAITIIITENGNSGHHRTAENDPVLQVTYTGGNTYPASSCTKSDNYLIKDVIFAGISNTGTGKSSYTDYTAQHAAVETGSSYTLDVKIKKNKHKYLKVWFDWNHDYDFTDAGEEYTLATDVNGEHTYSQSITVPTGAHIGTTRMRVTVLKNSAPTSTGSQGDKGEVEDYSVDISAPPAQADIMFYVSDSDDKLYKINRQTGACSEVGSTGRSSVETIANWPGYDGSTIYACDAGDFGTINMTTGAFTLISEVDGGGTANGSDGPQHLNDVDGLALDARTGIIWASNRRSSDYDLLFKIDPSTGQFIPDAFGSGVDYLVIDGTGVHYDIDDIAIDPVTGEIVCTNNDGGSNDVLLSIDRATGAVTLKSTFQTIHDDEGAAFANDGNFYVSNGSNNGLYLVNPNTGTSTAVNSSLCGSGDVEALACLMDKANRMEGNLWKDDDLDGIKDAGETTGISGVSIKIYLDNNSDGQYDSGDEYLNTVKTDASGDWYFDFAVTGDLVAVVETSTLPSGYALTTGNNQSASFSSMGNLDSGNDFGANTGSDCDGDGIPDFVDGSSLDSDGDGVANKCDLDSDNDGILDSEEGTDDTDGDGIADYLDLDSDNDGIPDAIEANNGVAPNGYSSSTGRITGADSDGDGLLNDVDAAPNTAYGSGSTSTLDRLDHDNDGVKDYVDLDSDNDGLLDVMEAGGTDTDGDGHPDSFTDNNNDGYNDSFTSSPLPIPNTDASTEAVTLPDYIDMDSDGDGMDDLFESYPTGSYEVPTIILDDDGDGILNDWDIDLGGSPRINPNDQDGDGKPDYKDVNSDNDSVWDIIEGNDVNQDGVADSSPSGNDADKNGIDDTFDRDCSEPLSMDIVADDYAEERNSNGDMYLTSSDLELCYDSHLQTVGIHFSNVKVNQGAVISEAYLQFQADETNTGSVTVTIKGQDVDNAPTFSSNDYDVTSRTTTSASISWSPGDWNTVGEAGTAQKVVITSIIQEIVNRSGWSNDNSIVIIISGNNTSNWRTAEVNPTLHIATGTGSKSGTTTCYACGTNVPAQDADQSGQRDFRESNGDSGGLPINLIDLKVAMDGDAARVDWATAAEINNNYFIVERSKDGMIWEEIGTVKGAGNSNVKLNYNYYDDYPYTGISYYRLTQVDFDGTTSTTKKVVLDNHKEKAMEVTYYPNPTDGKLFLTVSENARVEIRSMDGRLIETKTVMANEKNEIDLTNESKGIYFLNITTSSQRIIKKLIVR